jgi:hypothetical protein
MPSAVARLERSARLASRWGPGWMVYPAWSRSWRMSRMRLLIVSGRTLNRAATATWGRARRW